MLDGSDLVAFVASCDLDASDRFYRGVLGLELVESSDFANAYDVNGTQLRVTRVEAVAPASYTVAGWRVADLAAVMRALRAAGVVFKRFDGMAQNEHGVWLSPGGARVAWFADPDANTLSLQQAPQR